METETHTVMGPLDRAEMLYLRLLRGCAILAASVMLLFAAWSGGASLFNYLQSLQSVEPAEVLVSESEMIAAATPPNIVSSNARPTVDEERKKLPNNIYSSHAQKMYQVWMTEFDPFRATGEQPLSFDEFSEWYQSEYINGTLRQYNILDWVLNEQQVRNDLDKSIEALAKAARNPKLVARMKAFQSGKSTNPFWDRYDQAFMRLTDSYWLTLKVKRDAEVARATAKRTEIARRGDEASGRFAEARNALAGFLVLMFFFLVVAIERHQRRIAGAIVDMPAAEGKE